MGRRRPRAAGARHARRPVPQVDAARPHRGQLPAHRDVHAVRRGGAAGAGLRGHGARRLHRGVPARLPLHRQGRRGGRRAHHHRAQDGRQCGGHDPRRGRDHRPGRSRSGVQPGRARAARRRAPGLLQGDEVGPRRSVEHGRRRADGRPPSDAGRVGTPLGRGARGGRRGHRLRPRQARRDTPQRAPLPGPAGDERRAPPPRRRTAPADAHSTFRRDAPAGAASSRHPCRFG